MFEADLAVASDQVVPDLGDLIRAAVPGRGATPTFVSEAPLMRRSEASDLSVIVTYSAHDISAAERAAA